MRLLNLNVTTWWNVYKDLRFMASVIDQRLGQTDKKPAIPTYTFRGQDKKIPSVSSGVGNATLKETLQYTGTKMLGVAQLHKSNAVPVFQEEDIVDISHMRR